MPMSFKDFSELEGLTHSLGLCRYIDKPICTGFLQYDTVRLSVSRRIDTKGSNSN